MEYYPSDLHEYNLGYNHKDELVILDWGFFFKQELCEHIEQAIHDFGEAVDSNSWWRDAMYERNFDGQYYMEELGQTYAPK